MKISIVLTAFNGSNDIADCLDSIMKLDYPAASYEVIAVDDGSSDNTVSILENYKEYFKDHKINLSIIKNEINEGRILARIIGVSSARHERILIVDTQMRLKENFLNEVKKYKYDIHLITNLIMDKYLSPENTVMYLLRKKYYHPYWGIDFSKVKINEKNFNKISKGTGGFITNKKEFLTYSNELNGLKTENEDTKLFYKYIESGQTLLRIPEAKALYVNRSGFTSVKHIFRRGPRFVDYYFRNDSKYRHIFILTTLLGLLLVFLLITSTNAALLALIFCVALIIAVSILLAENIKDFLIVAAVLPLIALSFYLGVLYGVYKNWKMQ